MPELIIKLGDNVVQKYFFVNEAMSIGRAPDNEIVIENLAISRNHAVITTSEEAFMIKDLGSSNGTFVNGAKVQQALLTDKDVIAIGKHKLHFYDSKPVREVMRRPTLADADCTMLVTHVPVMAELEQIRGKHHATVHSLNGEVVRLGRGAQSDIRLSDWFVSKEHATITRVDDAFVLRDLGSWRHTYVNDKPIEEVVLRHDDVIQLGPTVQFRFAITSGMDLPEAAPAPRLVVSAMPTYEPPSEFKLTSEPAYEDPAMREPETASAAQADSLLHGAMTSRFDADAGAEHSNGVYESALQSEEPVRLEDIVEKIAVVSVNAAAEALSTDPHPEPPTLMADEPASEAEPAAPVSGLDSWMNQFPQHDEDAQHTMRLATPEAEPEDDAPQAMAEAEVSAMAERLEPQAEEIVVSQVEFSMGAAEEIETALAESAEADQAAEPSPEMPEAAEQEEASLKNEASEEQPELAEVGVAADTGNPSDEQHLGEDVRIWERALQNRSAVIRKQAARKLKQLTGKDYDY